MPRPSTGANLNISQLEQILNARRTELNKLYKQRREAQRRLDEVDREIARIGGDAAAEGGRNGSTTASGRARNEQSLPEVLEVVMQSGKPMKVGEIVDAVQAAGYRSNSANFRAIINQTLIKERKRFQSTGERGTYQIKK